MSMIGNMGRSLKRHLLAKANQGSANELIKLWSDMVDDAQIDFKSIIWMLEMSKEISPEIDTLIDAEIEILNSQNEDA